MKALSFLVLISLSACGGTQIIKQEVNLPPGVLATPTPAPTTDPVATAVVQVIHDNANALNGGDEARFMATFHAESEFGDLPVFYQRLRNQFLTRYNIAETRVQGTSESSASVMVKRRTSDYTGTIEQDVLYGLRKDGTNWKIVSMTIQAARPVS